MLVAVIILFVFLLVVILQSFTINNSSSTLGQIYTVRGECMRLAFAISQVYSEGNGAESVFVLDDSARILSFEKSVSIGGVSCGFLARSTDYNLSPGTILLKNNSGIVEAVIQ